MLDRVMSLSEQDFLEEEINVESLERVIWGAFPVDKLFFPYQSCPGNCFLC
jgi:hypothetical protein